MRPVALPQHPLYRPAAASLSWPAACSSRSTPGRCLIVSTCCLIILTCCLIVSARLPHRIGPSPLHRIGLPPPHWLNLPPHCIGPPPPSSYRPATTSTRRRPLWRMMPSARSGLCCACSRAPSRPQNNYFVAIFHPKSAPKKHFAPKMLFSRPSSRPLMPRPTILPPSAPSYTRRHVVVRTPAIPVSRNGRHYLTLWKRRHLGCDPVATQLRQAREG